MGSRNVRKEDGRWQAGCLRSERARRATDKKSTMIEESKKEFFKIDTTMRESL